MQKTLLGAATTATTRDTAVQLLRMPRLKHLTVHMTGDIRYSIYTEDLSRELFSLRGLPKLQYAKFSFAYRSDLLSNHVNSPRDFWIPGSIHIELLHDILNGEVSAGNGTKAKPSWRDIKVLNF